MQTIDVTDAGPIEGTFPIDLSPGPGVYEFRGRRGSGKSTLLYSIDWIAGHKVDITLHDGALSGKIEGFGVVAPIGGHRRRKGECEVDTIDAEKFSLTDLIDPAGKTPEVRDATRIKALAVLSETKADTALYYHLAGGPTHFDELGIPLTLDPVLLATRVKSAFDKEAKAKQNTADAEAGHAASLEVVPDGLDMTEESDLSVLGGLRDRFRDDVQTMKSDRETGLKAEQEASLANVQLATLKEKYDGPTTKEAVNDRAVLGMKEAAARMAVDELTRQLAEATKARDAITADVELAAQKCQTAKQHGEAVTLLQATASQAPDYSSEEQIEDAEQVVADATESYYQGLRIHDVKQNQRKAKAHRDAEKEAEKEAASARNKAGDVFDILAASLHTTHLQIKSVDGNPRLFVEHPKRGLCAFDRVNGLSDGERVDYTLRELLPHIKSPGLLPIPQRVWQDLQPADRKRLHEFAVEKKLFLFGAQVSEGDLRVVYLGNEPGLTDNPTQTQVA